VANGKANNSQFDPKTFAFTKLGEKLGSARKSWGAVDDNGYSITLNYTHVHPGMTILVMGGSTSFGIGSSDNSITVPSDLDRDQNKIVGHFLILALFK